VQRHVGPRRDVSLDLGRDVMAGEHVAVEDHHRVVRRTPEQLGDVAQPASGAERLRLRDVVDRESQR
jgi:hypothetical protein